MGRGRKERGCHQCHQPDHFLSEELVILYAHASPCLCAVAVQLDLVAGETAGLFNLFYSSTDEIAALSLSLVDEFGFSVAVLGASSPLDLDGFELTTIDNQVSERGSESMGVLVFICGGPDGQMTRLAGSILNLLRLSPKMGLVLFCLKKKHRV